MEAHLEEKMKECPFCGNGSIGIKDRIIEARYYEHTSLRQVWAYCRYCGAEGSKLTIEAVDGYEKDIEAAAIEGWNKRSKKEQI